MPTKVSPNCVDIFQEEVDFKSPISEGLLTKIASSLNAVCESLTPTCTYVSASGPNTYQALPGSKFITVYGIGGGGGGGGLRADILDHNTNSGDLETGVAPTAGFEEGLPGGNTTFNSVVVGSGGLGGGSALAYLITGQAPGTASNILSASAHFWHGLGFGRRATHPDRDGFSPMDETFQFGSPFAPVSTLTYRKAMDPRSSWVGEPGFYLSHSRCGSGGTGVVVTSTPQFVNSGGGGSVSRNLSSVRLLGGGGQAGRLGICEIKSIPNAVYSYNVGSGGDNGGVFTPGNDTVANGVVASMFQNTSQNAADGEDGCLLIIDWGHS